MSAGQPVLVSIKSNWERITERPIIGKDVLELLSSSMYINPLSIYREYIQNSADSIEEAGALGLLSSRESGRIDIHIDPDRRTVKIRDNGTGISASTFQKTLIALGASRKRGTKARGFRGVGRLAGLGYCQELVFRSKSDGEREVSEMRWDCRQLKSNLRDLGFKGELEELINQVVRVQRCVAPNDSNHFFEVELVGVVRHGDDRLMSSQIVSDYLSQVAPVPFSPLFSFGHLIENEMRDRINLQGIRIHLNADSRPLFRPHADNFEARKGVTDRFTDVRFFDIPGKDGGLAARGWVLDHGYFGAIDTAASIKGLRLRSGNMQVGESDLLDDLFAERRFNSWVVGEVHVLDERILPNGRRDHFEQNVHFSNLESHLRPTAEELSRQCRQSSVRRNTIRQFDILSAQISENLAIITQGTIGNPDRQRLERDTAKALRKMEQVSRHVALESTQRKSTTRALQRYRRRLATLDHKTEHRALVSLSSREKSTVKRICSLIYECSVSKSAAKNLIDRVLSKL